MKYRYEKSTGARAKQTAIGTVVVGTLFAGLSCFLMIKRGGSTVLMGQMFGVLTLIVCSIMLTWSIVLGSKKARWLIEVTDDFVRWDAPGGIGETSFALPIADIDRVVCLESTEPELENRYSLITRSGDEVALKPAQSGVNINKFIQSLRDAGVAYEMKNPRALRSGSS